MEKEVIEFIASRGLSPFSKKKTLLKTQQGIFKTPDAKSVSVKFLQQISRNFFFSDTSNIWNYFYLGCSEPDIKRRQEFFKTIQSYSNLLIENIREPKESWRIPYSVIAVTENEQTFLELKKTGVPVRLLLSDSDISGIENYELVYIIDAEGYSQVLESVAGSVFVSNIDDVYLEKNLVELSAWKNIIESLNLQIQLPDRMKSLIAEINKLLPLLNVNSEKKVDFPIIEKALHTINQNIEIKIRSMTISGDQMMLMMQRGALPQQLNNLLNEEIAKTELSPLFFKKTIPLQLDEEEIEKVVKKESANTSVRLAKRILKEKEILKKIPLVLQELQHYILYLDFVGGIGRDISTKINYPILSDELIIEEAENRFLDNPQKISFHLSENTPCSILTGANSGGKTTLLEHILQIIIETQMGIPSNARIKIPLFKEVYYFAKNKGSTSKGAFETLLSDLSTIKPGQQTLILADEVEAVTEPGVAGDIMRATIQYFAPKGCFIVLATHLGKELSKNIPIGSRIDGIEATGLDSEFNLIVNHNPVLGRLARSTPELIIEKMAKIQNNEYLLYLYQSLVGKESIK